MVWYAVHSQVHSTKENISADTSREHSKAQSRCWYAECENAKQREIRIEICSEGDALREVKRSVKGREILGKRWS